MIRPPDIANPQFCSRLDSKYDSKTKTFRLKFRPNSKILRLYGVQRVSWVCCTAHLCTILLPTSSETTVLWKRIRADGRCLICMMSAVQPGPVVCSVEGLLIYVLFIFIYGLYSRHFLCKVSAKDQPLRCLWTVEDFTTCGATLLGLNLTVFTRSSMSRMLLMWQWSP